MNKLADYIEERTKIFATSEAWDNGIENNTSGLDLTVVLTLWQARFTLMLKAAT